MLGFVGDLYDEAVGVGEDIVESVKNLAEEGVDAAQSAAEAVYDALEDGIDALLELGDDVLEQLDDFGKTIVKAAKDLAEAIEDVGKAIGKLVEKLGAGLKAIADFAKGVALSFLEMVEAVGDWAVQALADIGDWVVNDFMPAVWGGLKLIVAVAALCFFWPPILLGLLVCNLVRQEFGHEPGTVGQAILRGSKRYDEMFQILRLPAQGRYVIVSDIHRWSDKDEQEAGIVHHSRDLFDRVLEHYGAGEPAAGRIWSLIENGDVEDYWLSGGSWWGVVYDMASVLPAPALDIKFLDDGLLTAARVHQKRIFSTHARTYARIRAYFSNLGRYFRTIGNHDDINSRPEMQKGITDLLPGAKVADYIVLDEPGKRGVALIAHGHQTDTWNHGACRFLGRMTTSLAGGMRDLPLISSSLGLPDEHKRDRAWSEPGGDKSDRRDDILDQVSPFGADTDLGSLDEGELFESFRRVWGLPGPGIPEGPWVLLGHTHTPLIAPSHPDTHAVWARYVNSGCCIFPGMITTIEWDNEDGGEPQVRLVAWRWKKDTTLASAQDTGREIVARRLKATNDHGWLQWDGDFSFNPPALANP